MKKVIIIATILMSLSPTVTYSDYVWYDWGGHQYALTQNVGTWEQAEAEAQALNINYHLVTINSIDENTWLTSTLGPPLTVPISSYEWIGFYQDHADPLYSEPDGGWKWISGEAITFVNWNQPEPNNYGQEDYGVLQFEGVWNDWGPGATLGYWDTYGIIETPEPATLMLFTLGGLILRKRKPQISQSALS